MLEEYYFDAQTLDISVAVFAGSCDITEHVLFSWPSLDETWKNNMHSVLLGQTKSYTTTCS